MPPYVIDMIRELSPGWDYKHFSDAEIIDFFKENPIDEFPHVTEKFYSFLSGCHRADLFRYYYLFVKGGVYVDSDAMIEVPIDQIVKDYDFFSVNSSYYKGTIFQGFIGCNPGNKIMYEALKDAYYTPNERLIQEFHLLCKNMTGFIKKYENIYKIKLFEEVKGSPLYAAIKDGDTVVLKHWSEEKIIPKREHK